jgi:hypothetical protein
MAGCDRAHRRGNRNAFKHGHHTAEAFAEQRELRALLREIKGLVEQLEGKA